MVSGSGVWVPLCVSWGVSNCLDFLMAPLCELLLSGNPDSVKRPQVRPSHPTDGVREFHVLFLSLVSLENVFAYDRISYGW